MQEAKLKGKNAKGQELRYAHRRDMCWPGHDEPLGLAGYWVGDDEECHHLGRKVNWEMLSKAGFEPTEPIKAPSDGRNMGFNRLCDDEGRPLQLRRPVRNRVSPSPNSGRLVYERTIRNIVWAEGRAEWLLEDIPIDFKAVGYCKFPDDIGAVMVALEVAGDKEVGWVRVDPHSVQYRRVEP